MPYLRRCLASLARQTIGPDRMEIIAVDDGSTDGSGGELDRFARRHGGPLAVIHQANSGGPAAPSNRALDLVAGRYVFFLGADDYLGPEALQRLVSTADTLQSDVVLGRVVGANGRWVSQKIYARNRPDVTLFDSALPWALSNTKLFRRALIDRYGLRFPEELAVGSDQPFTLAACLRARRVSVLADYDFYYAVRRADRSNITYCTSHAEHLRCARFVMDFVADLLPAGPRRDAVLLRHFMWEVGKLLRADFLPLDEATKEHVVSGVRDLAKRYLTDGVRARLDASTRVRLALAQHGHVPDVVAAIAQDVRRPTPRLVMEGGRCFARYPGFRDPRRCLPDDWFDVTEQAADLLAGFEAESLTWEPTGGTRALTISARGPLTDVEAPPGPIEIVAKHRSGTVPAQARAVPAARGGMLVRARLPIDPLLARSPADTAVWAVQAQVSAFGGTGSAGLLGPRPAVVRRLLCRRGMRMFLVTATTGERGRLVVAVTPVTAARLLGYLRRLGRLPRPRRAR